MEQIQNKKQRVKWLDYLRGIGIIFVMWYHLMYDLWDFYGMCGWIHSTGMDVFRDCMVAMLVLVSGICCYFSRNNLRRGIICFAIARGLTVVTYFMNPQAYIRFGILHMFGISMILYGIVSPFLRIKRKWIATVLIFAVFLLTFSLQFGAIGVYRFPLLEMPDMLYQTKFLFWAGFPDSSFVSADYYPLLLWTALFFTEAFWVNT